MNWDIWRIKRRKKMKPKNYKDLKWRKFSEEKPTAENGSYLCICRRLKYSKYIKYKIDYFGNHQYPTYHFSEVSISLWKKENVVYWMPLPDLPV